MMQPSFDDLVEYVRAGETDPEMQELLAGNPDGQELLKQARFICKVLHDRYGASGDASNVADADAAFDDQSEALGLEAAMRAPMASDVATSYESASFQKPRRRQPPPVEYLLARISSERQDLGTLSFSVDEQRVAVSYQPSLVVASYTEKFLRNIPTPQLGLPSVQIHSMGLNISLPESIAVGDPITLRLSRGLDQAPAGYLNLVFMPETGPFVNFRCDKEGDAVLPAPIQSGVLRIGSSEPHILQIKVEAS